MAESEEGEMREKGATSGGMRDDDDEDDDDDEVADDDESGVEEAANDSFSTSSDDVTSNSVCAVAIHSAIALGVTVTLKMPPTACGRG